MDCPITILVKSHQKKHAIFFLVFIQMSATLNHFKPGKRESESGLISKARDIELPNINQTMNRVYSKRSSSSLANTTTFSEKVKWISETISYDAMSEGQISRQGRRLHQTIKSLNTELAKILDRLPMQKSPSKPIEPEYVSEVRSKEIDNSQKMLTFYKLEYAKLQKRLSQIGQQGSRKQNIDREIRDAKDQIDKVKTDIKDLKKKSNALGNNILDSQSLINEMRRLEYQNSLAETKKIKITQQFQRVENELQSYTIKQYEIIEQFQKADQFLRGICQKDQRQKEQKSSQSHLLHKRYTVDSVKKKIQSMRYQFQQTYLRKLKELEFTVQNVGKASEKISLLDKDLIQSRAVIQQLEQKLKLRQFFQTDREKDESTTFFLTKPLQSPSHHKLAEINLKSEQFISHMTEPEMPKSKFTATDGQKIQFNTIHVPMATKKEQPKQGDQIMEDILQISSKSQIQQILEEEKKEPEYQISKTIQERNLELKLKGTQKIKEEFDKQNELPPEDFDLKKKVLLQKLKKFNEQEQELM